MGKINAILGQLGGRKFLMALAAVIAIVLQEKFGISEQQTLYIAGVAASFIFAQGAADGLSKSATSTIAALASDDKSAT